MSFASFRLPLVSLLRSACGVMLAFALSGCGNENAQKASAIEEAQQALAEGDTDRANRILQSIRRKDDSSQEGRDLAQKLQEVEFANGQKELITLKGDYEKAIAHADIPVAYDIMNKRLQIASKIGSPDLITLRAEQSKLIQLNSARAYYDTMRKMSYIDLLECREKKKGEFTVFPDANMDKIFWDVLVRRYLDKEIDQRNLTRSNQMDRKRVVSSNAIKSEWSRAVKEHQTALQQLILSIRRAAPPEKLMLLQGVLVARELLPPDHSSGDAASMLRRFEVIVDKYGPAGVSAYDSLSRMVPNLLIYRGDGDYFTLGMQRAELLAVIPDKVLALQQPLTQTKRKFPDVNPAEIDAMIFTEANRTFGYPELTANK